MSTPGHGDTVRRRPRIHWPAVLTIARVVLVAPVVVLTKADLHPDAQSAALEVESVAIGVDVHPVSNVTGDGIEALNAYLRPGRTAVLHGSRSAVLSDEDGQVVDAESISAGLDYPGAGPEHAFLRDAGRAEYASASDDEALEAFRTLARTEGILPALEPAHALARVPGLAEELVLVCLSGRGDKDLAQVVGL